MTDKKTLSPRPHSEWQPDDEDSLDDDSMLEERAPGGKKDSPAHRHSTWQSDDEDSLDDDSMA